MIQLKNNAQSVLASPAASSAATLTLSIGDGALFPPLSIYGDHFFIALSDNSGNVEYCDVTAVIGDVLTVSRGQEGTIPRSWNTGTRVQLRLTAKTWECMDRDTWKRLTDSDNDPIAPVTVSANSFSVTGDHTADFAQTRAFRLYKSGSVQYGYVASATYGGGVTTVTQYSASGYTPPSISGTYYAVDLGIPLNTVPYSTDTTPVSHLTDTSAHSALFTAKQDALTFGDGLSLTGATLSLAEATTSLIGGVIPDGVTVTVADGVISVPTATTSAAGICMVDDTLNASSTHAIQNMTVKAALDAKQDTLTIDTAMSDVSTNTVRNNVIKSYVDTAKASAIPTGSVFFFASASAPTGYLVCNGQAVSRTTYAALFAITGTTYGSGDGSTTFNLPDLTDKTVWGGSSVGTVKTAGLPNITGSSFNYGWETGYGETVADGAMAWTDYSSRRAGHNGTATGTQKKMTFSAADGEVHSGAYSNLVYGKSDTVQPPALVLLPCIKY